jgi:hypothetical protein
MEIRFGGCDDIIGNVGSQFFTNPLMKFQENNAI